jgi:hypothetical protein
MFCSKKKEKTSLFREIIIAKKDTRLIKTDTSESKSKCTSSTEF